MRLLSGLVLTEAEVVAARAVSRAFHHLQLRVLGPRRDWQPGDKVQVLLPDDEVRTFTPLCWEADGSTALLVYAHGAGPASRWAPLVRAGQRLRFFGPSRSLVMPGGAKTLIGDETSLAVAASYARVQPAGVRTWLEVGDSAELAGALEAAGLEQVQVVQRKAGAPRGHALLEALPALQGPVGITGSGELIQQVRAGLRQRGILDIKTKAYWVQGRAGLD